MEQDRAAQGAAVMSPDAFCAFYRAALPDVYGYLLRLCAGDRARFVDLARREQRRESSVAPSCASPQEATEMSDLPPSYRIEPDVEFADRLERVLVQRLTAPSTATATSSMVRDITAASGLGTALGNGWTGDHGESIGLEFTAAPQRPAGHRRMLKIVLGAAAAAAFVVALAAIVRTADDSAPADVPSTTVNAPTPTTTVDPGRPSTPFVGIWLSTDTDGSTQTMEIATTDDGSMQLTIHDDRTGPCSGGAATITGVGRFDSGGDLVVAAPAFTCDDGTTPVVLSPPVDEQLRDLTFAHDPRTDTVTDSFGVVWRREGAEASNPATTPFVSENMWPQSSLEGVREAQRLADAGDPAYTWQVEPPLNVGDEVGAYLVDQGSEVVDRFLREVLGWDRYLFHSIQGTDSRDPGYYGVARGEGVWEGGPYLGIVYLRCAPGEANPLYPTESSLRGVEPCAPTIDDLHYETVSLDLARLDRRGPDGVWVVSDWRMTTPFAQADPAAAEADVTARLEDFLQARIDGEGAEGFVAADPSPEVPPNVPLLYATTTGAPFERYEVERVGVPQWPDSGMDFKVRLFADGGQTVVEQDVWWWDTLPVPLLRPDSTTENGQPVAARYRFYDGEVTALAAQPWRPSCGSECLESGAGWISLAAIAPSVATGCLEDATAPMAVTIGGVAAQAIDGTLARGGLECQLFTFSWVDRGNPVRLYVLDLPEGSSTPTLAIAVVADEMGHGFVTGSFEEVIAAATPVIESIEFHPRGG